MSHQTAQLFLGGLPDLLDRRLTQNDEAALGFQVGARGISSSQRRQLAFRRLGGLLSHGLALFLSALQNGSRTAARFFGDLDRTMVRAFADLRRQCFRISEDRRH